MDFVDSQRTSEEKSEKEEIHRILFYEAQEALDELKTIKKDGSGLLSSHASWSNLKSLLKTLLVTKPNVILFLGAGTSMSIKKKSVGVGETPYKALSWDGLLRELFLGLDEDKQKEFLIDQTVDHEHEISDEDKEDNGVWFEKIRFFRDKPTLAWHLRLYFNHDYERNKKIYELVSKPLESVEFESPTIRQIVKLPFHDIITTNFDSSINRFLREENEFRKTNRNKIRKFQGYEVENLNVSEIYNPGTFLSSIAAQPKHRLFYIHGKADKNGKNFLVFDKFDFAQLIAQKDSILEYLIGQIINSTLIYFGFGLDDQTFNYIQERLRKIFRQSIETLPFSYTFSTQKSQTEISAYEKKHIKVISYTDHDKLPRILEHINKILEYFRQFPENELSISIPSGKDITFSYQKAGRDKYVQEDYEESLKNYRLAIATLLFSGDIEATNREQLPQKIWENDKTLIEIRRQLALNLSKLRWKEPISYENNTELLNGTIDRAVILLEECEKKFANTFSPSEKIGIQAHRASIDVLKARIKAHEGNIQDSFNKYQAFQDTFRDQREAKEFLDTYQDLLAKLPEQSYRRFRDNKERDYERVLRKIIESNDAEDKKKKDIQSLKEKSYKYEINEDILLLGYSYIFAREQRKRHQTFLGASDNYPGKTPAEKEQLEEKEKADDKNKYKDNYKNLIRELTKWKNRKYFKNELSISLQTLGGVLIIGLWEIASRLVRYSSGDLLPNDVSDFDDNILTAIELFSEDKEKFNKKRKKIPLEDGTRISILPSERWQTRMYRHKCRAYMLRWVKNEMRQLGTGDKSDLLSAFTSFKKALDSSEKETLKGESLKNCLESVRMNALVMLYTPEEHPSYILSESAGYYYLSQALETVHQLLDKKASDSACPFDPPDKKSNDSDLKNDDLGLEEIRERCRKTENWHVWWLMIFVLKIASYFKIVVGNEDVTELKAEVFRKKALAEFFKKDYENIKTTVSHEYELYADEVMKNVRALDKVIERYETDYEKLGAIKSEKHRKDRLL